MGRERLRALCTAVDMKPSLPAAMQLFDGFLAGWGDRQIGDLPAWRSNITDDHTPFGLALAIQGGRPELRFLVEVQGQPTNTLESSWTAGQATNEWLRRDHGVSLDALHRIEDLFVPRDPAMSFAMWHAVGVRDREPPDIKLYLNPRARGASEALPVVAEALRRNGFDGAARFITDHLPPGTPNHIVYFSLDLALGDTPRIKVYVAYPDITAGQVEAHLVESGSALVPGEASAFCGALLGGGGPYRERAIDIAYEFADPRSSRPSEVTLHAPIRAYVVDDAEAVERINRYLDRTERPVWRRALCAVARRPLASDRGLVQWVSLNRRQGQRRVTFYFTPEAYPLHPRARASGANLVIQPS